MGEAMANANSLFSYYGLTGDQSGRDWFQNQLDTGAMTEAQVRSALVASPEYQSLASSSTSPFTFGDHDNDPNTMPTLTSNPNSSISWDHNVNGQTGTSVVYGDGFDAFTMDSNNATNPYSAGTPDGWGSSGSSSGTTSPYASGATANQTDWSSLMGGLNSLFQSQSDSYSNLLSQQQSAFSDMFSDLNDKQDAATNAWVTDFNQSSVLPPQYQVGMGGAKNGSALSWQQGNNPWNVRTF